MLDIMRQKKRMTSLVLWGVIIALALSMAVWGISLYQSGGSGGAASGSYAAVVDGYPISMKEFIETYRQSIKVLQENAKTEIDPETLKSLGVSQQILNRLIRGKIVEILSARLGISVTQQELIQAIKNLPGLQINGKFIGLDRYKMVLANAGYSPETFEDDMRYEQLANKLTHVVTDALEVSDQEVRKEFSRMNQKSTVEYVLLNKDSFKKQVKPTDAELKTYFEENKGKYTVPEKRRATYLLVPTSKILPDIQVSDKEIQDEWDKNPAPETVEAAHILFLVKDPSKDEEVRAKAEAVLKQAKAGADFGDLARKYSEDTSSAKQGGYLGTFPRGQMPKEFEDVAFSLKPGEISDLVHTDYGYQIIKVFRHDVPTLESNRSELISAIRIRKAKEIAKQDAEKAVELAKAGKDFNAIGKDLNIATEVKETSLFEKDENPFSLGISQSLRDEIFQLESIGSIGKVVEHPMGFAFARLEEIQPSRPGVFQEFTDKVKEDYITVQSGTLMEAAAEKISEEASRLRNLSKAAADLGYKTKTTREFKVDESPDPDIKNVDAFNAVAFKLEPGSISKPIPMSDTTAVLEVKTRSPFDEAAFEKEKDSLHKRMYTSLQEAYLEDYFRTFREELEEGGKIRINPSVFEQVEKLRF